MHSIQIAKLALPFTLAMLAAALAAQQTAAAPAAAGGPATMTASTAANGHGADPTTAELAARVDALEREVEELKAALMNALAANAVSHATAAATPAPAGNPATAATPTGATAPAAGGAAVGALMPASPANGASPPPEGANPAAVAAASSTAGAGAASASAVTGAGAANAAAGTAGTSPADAAAGPSNVAAALTANQTPEPNAKEQPFSFGDMTWLNGSSRVTDLPFDSKFFTPEIRFDISYIEDFAHPADDTLVGSSESGRTDEVQLQQLGVGGDFHWDNVRGRIMTQLGMYSTMTPRNDPTSQEGQWDLADAYRYISEGYGGYHFNVLDGINVDAGIFMSYIGLFSYYNFDNWAYQPSYVSSNTPWFFNGVRVQIFPTAHLKIEPWIINGWQSYGSANGKPGLGGQILYRPNDNWNFISNNYGFGHDDIGDPERTRWHTDNSIERRYRKVPDSFFDMAAWTLTGDLGCETGDGVDCVHKKAGVPLQYFAGFMVYNRFWFDNNRYGFTVGGGAINNPGRYLVLLPPIDGATAFTGTPYFPESPGDPFKAWDTSATFDWMPQQYITWRMEFDHRAANVAYFAGPGGVTPPGGNNGDPDAIIPGWSPDLRKYENRVNLALLVMF